MHMNSLPLIGFNTPFSHKYFEPNVDNIRTVYRIFPTRDTADIWALIWFNKQ